MQSTVTLELYEYNELYSKALYHENLEIENKQLKEELAIAHKQLEELQQPKEDTPTCEVGMGNPKIAGSTEESKEKFRAKYLDLNCKNSPYIAVINGEKLRGTIISDLDDNKEKQDTENYKTPDELLIELIQKQGLYVTYLQIKELINRQPK